MRYVRFACGVPQQLLLLLYRCCAARVLLDLKGSVGWSRPGWLLCSGWHAHTTPIYTETAEQFVAVTNNNLEVRRMYEAWPRQRIKHSFRFYTGPQQQTAYT